MATKSAEIVYAQIKGDIINNVYKAQQRIAEEDLAKKYECSRTPIREALRKLEAEGFVSCVKNVGTFVRRISAREVSDFYDARGVLEGLTARLAAQSAQPELARELEDICAQVLEAHSRRDLARANALDQQFHSKINEASENAFVIRSLKDMQDRLHWFLNISNISRMDYLGTVPIRNMHYSHDDILKAIGAGDPVRAEKLARAHVDEAKKYFIDYCYDKFML